MAVIDVTVDLAAHEALDTLTHRLAEDEDVEFAYSSGDLMRVTHWTDAGRTTKIREIILSYTSGDLTGVVATQHDGTGAVIATLTKTLAYVGGVLDTVTAVRT